ncbi:MAG: histidine ammonia-lyase [Flavobacteriales bacterium]
MNTHNISPAYFSISDVEHIIASGSKIALSDDAKNRITKCREYLDKRLSSKDEAIYGINTGFGSLCNTVIPKSELEQLQLNLVKSHACGMGSLVPKEIVKLMLLLKIQGLSYGHSGISLETTQLLIDFFNHDIIPEIFEQGSLGASGDLSPLAHLSLPLIGEGFVYVKNERKTAREALLEANLTPVKLRSKEGLALLNGTQFMSAYATWACINAKHQFAQADKIAALSLDAFDGRIEPFSELVHKARPHKGQIETASNIRALLKDSEIAKQNKTQVQDPYSFRCIPQVHGAVKDTLNYVISVVETEINSVTDNPTIFPDEDLIVSAGNFHGEPLALVLDQLAIALSELGSVSERRVYKLISGTHGLPPFLASGAGLNSGLMIPQYTAASIVSQNKQLCTPASVDSIDSSNGQEDHVSMGANGATKLHRVVNNLYRLLGIELLTASQAIEYRRPLKTSTELEHFLSEFRQEVPACTEDRWLAPEMQKAEQFLKLKYF